MFYTSFLDIRILTTDIIMHMMVDMTYILPTDIEDWVSQQHPTLQTWFYSPMSVPCPFQILALKNPGIHTPILRGLFTILQDPMDNYRYVRCQQILDITATQSDIYDPDAISLYGLDGLIGFVQQQYAYVCVHGVIFRLHKGSDAYHIETDKNMLRQFANTIHFLNRQ